MKRETFGGKKRRLRTMDFQTANYMQRTDRVSLASRAEHGIFPNYKFLRKTRKPKTALKNKLSEIEMSETRKFRNWFWTIWRFGPGLARRQIFKPKSPDLR
jgi:hypothetical protein